jgi:hypothetical protein
VAQPLREGTHDLEAAGRCELTGPGNRMSPCESEGDGQRPARCALICETGEGKQLSPCDTQLEAQSSTLSEVEGDGVHEGHGAGAHRDLPGQGSATACNRGRSTLA